ncbi:N-acetylglucosaminidase [Anaerostipes faecalis]|uniref:N-acetylglucosaminidase n=1 Tax=Anaerostipes faecalis TaxID=2738446 RepID=UPI001C1DE821|nr:glucosaminidase domain-containing protein [Anaerostipes faecalis]
MKIKKLVACLLTASFLACITPPENAQAAPLKIRYGGKTRYYTGKQLSFTYAKNNLSSKYPGIQISGINMIPYYDYLVSSGPQVKRSYNKKSGKLVLKYGTRTLTAYVGKRTYYLNGKKKTFSKAPTKVKYYTTGKTIILLPANALISNLGLEYSYIPYEKRIHINKTGYYYLYSANTSTRYPQNLTNYIKAQLQQTGFYNGEKLTAATYKAQIDPASDTTHGYQFLRLNVYRPVRSTTYNSMLDSKLKSGSVLKNKGSSLCSAAKTYNIDPVYFLCQTIFETGYGTSTLSQGKYITKVVSGSSVVRDKNGIVTGFKKVNGKYITKTISRQKVYNLYGLKSYDDDPQLCGFSYAYYMGWTSIDKAINGAAKYISQEYINNTTYKQNTLYKYRYNPNTSYFWHQYSTDPAYAQRISLIMYNQFRSAYATGNILTYDKPVFP